ncbi:MAG: polymorphic toxin type 47 domain-containing protein [Bacilli bacterium]|nr:polymorphic toxin type 47 domain-containing protein [Bacilli bacterium]
MAYEQTGYNKDQFIVSKWARDLNGKSIPVEYMGTNGLYVDIDIAHPISYDRNGNWATGLDVPHVGWQTGRSNKITGHILLDSVPTGRDYCYSDLSSQIIF